jgi:hypothetical protein
VDFARGVRPPFRPLANVMSLSSAVSLFSLDFHVVDRCSALRVVLFDLAHRGVDLGADVGGLRQRQQVVEARIGGEVEDAFGVVSDGFIDPAAAPG